MTATDPSLRPPDQLDPDRWGAFRRVHFFVNDLIMDGLDRMGVTMLDRRLLDALAFAERRGVGDGLPVATICALIPPSPKPQTALSALVRLAEADRGWFEQRGERRQGRRGKRFRLGRRGRIVRADYQRLAEIVLRETYSGADAEQRQALLAHGEAVMRLMDNELGPLIDSLVPPTPVEIRPRSGWAALRAAHFHLNDLFFARAAKLGVEPLDRRLLDALSFAASRGIDDGLSLATMSALVTPAPRPGLTATSLERMGRLGWVEGNGGRRPAQQRWRLVERGRQIRSDYKGFAERQIGLAYAGVEEGAGPALLQDLAHEAEVHRLRRLEPILRHRQG